MVIFTEELTSDGRAPLVSPFAAYWATAGAAPAGDIERKPDGAPERGQRPVEYEQRCQRSQEKMVIVSLETNDHSECLGRSFGHKR